MPNRRPRPALTLAPLLVLALAAAGCRPGPQDAPQASSYLRQSADASFRVVASYEHLGPAWLEHGGAQAVAGIFTDAKLNSVLIQFFDGDSLWLDMARGRSTEWIDSFGEVFGTDSGLTEAYVTVQPGRFNVSADSEVAMNQRVTLPEYDPPDGLFFQFDELLGFSSNPAFGGWWEAGISTDEGLLCARFEGGKRTAIFQLDMADPQATQQIELSCSFDGNLYYRTGDSPSVMYFDPAAGAPRAIARSEQAKSSLRADSGSQQCCWLYDYPETTSEGSGRNAGGGRPGRVRCISPGGEVLASMETGSIPFDVISGDWGNRRCLLLQDSIGVALLDFRQSSLTWLLRISDGTPLYISDEGNRIFALLQDAIVQISVNDLLELAPQLNAQAALSPEEASSLRPAVESLGWSWDRVLVTPLLKYSDGITLFDASDPESTWSEIDWSFEDNRADSLLIARVPNPTDESIREMSEGGIDAWAVGLLRRLGWPDCDLVDGSVDKYDLHYRYALVPDAAPPLTAGEFEVWITEGAAFYSLEGAKLSFPRDGPGIAEIRSAAAAACSEAAGRPGSDLLVQDLPEAGWAVRGPSGSYKFGETELDGAVPCYRVGCIRDGAGPMFYIVLVSALDGAVLEVSESQFSPLANLNMQRGLFSPLGSAD